MEKVGWVENEGSGESWREKGKVCVVKGGGGGACVGVQEGLVWSEGRERGISYSFQIVCGVFATRLLAYVGIIRPIIKSRPIFINQSRIEQKLECLHEDITKPVFLKF